jgi:hypothetical protein
MASVEDEVRTASIARDSITPDVETAIDETLADSFPASDAPSWTLGVGTATAFVVAR